ncbi:MAG: hypothetical protein Ct9H300mP25_17720 [Acidobacteriota bacterium]|nr:MAG: hypothetical protein Ct9H300mP25_17720 [Acidobacteriota bacterium]
MGTPDLQGVWDYRTLTPLERPNEFEGRTSLSSEKLAAFTARTLERRNNDQRREGEADVRGAYKISGWVMGRRRRQQDRLP